MPLRRLDRHLLLPSGHLLFAACHASTQALLPDGRLLVAFFAGTREGADDTAIWLGARCGATWLEPVRLLAEPGLAHWNPVLHAEGSQVWLFYKVGPDVQRWTTRVVISRDGGRSWSEPAPLVAGETAPRGPVKNKLAVLADGSWLAGGSVETDRAWDAFADLSPDQGRTWRRTDIAFDHSPASAAPTGETWAGLGDQALWENDPARAFAWDGVIQPTVWQSAPGHAHMLMRSTRGRIYRADSADGGRSWGAAFPTALPNNNSGLDLARLEDGRLALAFNPVSGNWGRRSPISVALSGDNGASWSAPFDLETREGEFSYPSILAAGHRLLVSYTADRRNIVHETLELAP